MSGSLLATNMISQQQHYITSQILYLLDKCNTLFASDPPICGQVYSLDIILLSMIKDGIKDIEFIKTHSSEMARGMAIAPALIYGQSNPFFCIGMQARVNDSSITTANKA
jgi:hypothetical protein